MKIWGMWGDGHLEYMLLPGVRNEKGVAKSANMNGDRYEQTVKTHFAKWKEKMFPRMGKIKIPLVKDFEGFLRQPRNLKAEEDAGSEREREQRLGRLARLLDRLRRRQAQRGQQQRGASGGGRRHLFAERVGRRREEGGGVADEAAEEAEAVALGRRSQCVRAGSARGAPSPARTHTPPAAGTASAKDALCDGGNGRQQQL